MIKVVASEGATLFDKLPQTMSLESASAGAEDRKVVWLESEFTSLASSSLLVANTSRLH